MLFILDSNEYIFSFGLFKKESCVNLLNTITEHFPAITIRIPRLIVEEVRSNLTPEEFKEFILFINNLTHIDEDVEIPFELGAKYEAIELKQADAFIAAYVEYVGADILVSENRHFLSRQSDLPFKVSNAQMCLKLIQSSSR